MFLSSAENYNEQAHLKLSASQPLTFIAIMTRILYVKKHVTT